VEQKEKKNEEKGERGQQSVAFEGAQVRRPAREKGGGLGLGTTWRGKWGRERGPRHGGGSLGGRHRPSAGWHGWRRCRATGEGGGAGAERTRAADKQDRAMSGPGGQWLGVGGSEREWGSTARGADRWARQNSAAQFSSKSNKKYSKWIQNSANFD
jgi:hypothetical protein